MNHCIDDRWAVFWRTFGYVGGTSAGILVLFGGILLLGLVARRFYYTKPKDISEKSG